MCEPHLLWWSGHVESWFSGTGDRELSDMGSPVFKIPDGLFAGITDMGMAEKHIVYHKDENPGQYWQFRNSYMVVYGCPTLTSHHPVINFSRPWIYQYDRELGKGHFTNASYEMQNMNGWIQFWLSEDPLFRDCR